MLDRLHEMATSSFGTNPHDELPVVLTIPSTFTNDQRSVMERSVVAAGFDLLASIEEPIAAMHAVESVVKQTEDIETLFKNVKGPIAVFDMGGYVSSFSLLQRQKPSYKILTSIQSTVISGVQVDTLLFDQVVKKFYEEVGIDLSIDHMASYRILEAVEAAKLELSSRKSTDINLPFITADQTGAKHLVHKLNTFDLNRILEKPINDMLTLCNDTLKSVGVNKDEIALLVLVGGGVRTDYIRKEFERAFKQQVFTSKSFQPEEAVVIGATEYGRRLIMED